MESSTSDGIDWGADRHRQGSLGIPLGDVFSTLANPNYRLPQPVLLEVPAGVVPDDLGVLIPDAPRAIAAVVAQGRMNLLARHADVAALRVHFLHATQTAIGRSRHESDVILPRESVSRRHCSISKARAGWQVVDEGSAQGTTLEGAPLKANAPTPLLGGQMLHVASYGALFLLPDQLHALASRIRAAPPIAARPDLGRVAPSPGFAPTPGGVRFLEVLTAAKQPGFLERWSTPCLLQIPVDRAERERRRDPLAETVDDTTPLDPPRDKPAMTQRISLDELKGLKQVNKVGEARLHPLAFSAGKTDLVVGRAERCDVILGEATVSKVHAKFGLGAGGEWFLTDTGSQNGTFVGGARLPPQLPVLLKGGERLWFAGYRALFLFPQQLQRLVANSLR